MRTEGSFVVEQLVKQALGDNRLLKFDALRLLPRYTATDDIVISAISKCFREGDRDLRKKAAEAYSQLLQNNPDPALGVLTLLDTDDWQERSRVVAVLGDCTPKSRALAQILISLLQDRDDSVRMKAVKGLRTFKRYSDIIVPAIEKAHSDEEKKHVRWEMERVLADLEEHG